MDILQQLGALALASRLQRLSERFRADVAAIYKAHQVEFESKWFPVFFAVYQKGKIGIMEIAQETGFTHPSVISLLKEMEKAGLVTSEKSANDERKRMVSLTEKAKDMIPVMEPAWALMRDAVHDLLKDNNHHLLFALEQAEDQMNRESLLARAQRIRKKRQQEEVEIIPYAPELKSHFQRLNEEWISKYFVIEEPDRQVFNNPESKILEPGGKIFFARYNEEIVGTCALIKENGHFELAKMAVTESLRGKQIGKKLGMQIIEEAKKMGADKLILVSNTKLVPAINLYKKLGFVPVRLNDHDRSYNRVDIKMELLF
jgi:DNA-binding MarR family transcriptional regulator/predicted GNAT family N-acyltransferase